MVTLAGSAASAARGSSPPGGRRPLRLLWAGQSVSLPGDQVTMLALPLAALAGGRPQTGRPAARARCVPRFWPACGISSAPRGRPRQKPARNNRP